MLYADYKAQRVSLPTYPFARERHWVPAGMEQGVIETNLKLHPLVHINDSDLNEQRYISTYSGNESFLSDHIVRDEKVLPGVAYLEMMREAGARSIGSKTIQLRNVAWLNPLRVSDKPEKINIRLGREGSEVYFDVCSFAGIDEVMHCNGSISDANTISPPSVNIDKLRSDARLQVPGKKIYETYKAAGLSLGISYQGIETLYVGEEYALSKIILAPVKGFIYTPGILDSTLQTIYGLNIGGHGYSLALPYCVREVNFYNNLSQVTQLWGYVRKSANNRQDSVVTNYDICLLNESGDVLLAMNDFAALPLDGGNHTPEGRKQSKSEVPTLHLYEHSWNAKGVEAKVTGTAEHRVILVGAPASLADKLRESLEVDVTAVSPTSETTFFISLLEDVKATIGTNKEVTITVVLKNDDYADYGFVSGLLKTATLENQK